MAKYYSKFENKAPSKINISPSTHSLTNLKDGKP